MESDDLDAGPASINALIAFLNTHAYNGHADDLEDQHPSMVAAEISDLRALRDLVRRLVIEPVDQDRAALRHRFDEADIGLAMTADGELAITAPNDNLSSRVLVAVAEILQAGLWHRLRACANREECAVVFLDQSRGGQRRWHAVETCGNRVNSRRHRARTAADA